MNVKSVCSETDIENTVFLEDVSSDSEILSSDTERVSQDFERMMREEAVSDRELPVRRQTQDLSPVQAEKIVETDKERSKIYLMT